MITLRPASLNDLDLLVYWDTKQHVIDCDPDETWDWGLELGRDPAWRQQFVADLDGKPIGFIQIIDPFLEETHYWGVVDQHKRAIDIWIGEETNLNKGYGTAMMELAIEKCFENSMVDAILVDPLKTNTKAHRFYESLGFVLVKERVFDKTPCYVYQLDRNPSRR